MRDAAELVRKVEKVFLRPDFGVRTPAATETCGRKKAPAGVLPGLWEMTVQPSVGVGVVTLASLLVLVQTLARLLTLAQTLVLLLALAQALT